MQRLFTQIQSGKFKGKKLFLPQLDTTRSTKNRVKACVFNVLRSELKDKIFIEVFGGSGAMAFEALSNGALECFILEKDAKAYEIALKNATLLKADKVKIHQGDSFELLPNLLKDLCQKPVIAYFDPPFHLRAGFEDIYEKVFTLIASLQNANLSLIIEHSSKISPPLQMGIFCRSKFKPFGKTSLSFYHSQQT